MPSGLAAGLRELGYEVEPVQTNMVYAHVGEQAGALKAFCAERGIVLTAAPRLRMVTHLDIALRISIRCSPLLRISVGID